jgi:hypothetical protein
VKPVIGEWRLVVPIVGVRLDSVNYIIVVFEMWHKLRCEPVLVVLWCLHLFT